MVNKKGTLYKCYAVRINGFGTCYYNYFKAKYEFLKAVARHTNDNIDIVLVAKYTRYLTSGVINYERTLIEY